MRYSFFRKSILFSAQRMLSQKHPFFCLFVAGIFLFFQGCATLPERRPVPEEAVEIAQIPGIPIARWWGDKMPRVFVETFSNFSQEDYQTRFPEVVNRPHHYLAISGGSSEGAFGAGFLVGWTASGYRPQFTMVTGISVGALIAPMAFLGPEFDSKLREIFTSISNQNILIERSWLEILTGDSLYDSKPLQNLIEKIFDENLAKAILAEHKKGRRLFIGTTNLDANRPVIWNIGNILESEHPKALELVRKVLLASSSIPGVLPPVYIKVQANGQTYDEIHVDGGAASQVFVYPAEIKWKEVAEKFGVKGKPDVYVIRNSKIHPDWEEVRPNDLINIFDQSITSLIRTQGLGDLNTIYLLSQRDQNDYHLVYIPEDFKEQSHELFDQKFMRALFNLGYDLGKTGNAWKKAPPGFQHLESDRE